MTKHKNNRNSSSKRITKIIFSLFHITVNDSELNNTNKDHWQIKDFLKSRKEISK